MGAYLSTNTNTRGKGNKSEIYFPDVPAEVNLRTTTGSGLGNLKGSIMCDLRNVVESRCPSLWEEFRAPWWLFNGHLQTLYCVVGDFTRVDRVVYSRTYLRLMDGGTLGLDFTPPIQDDGDVVDPQKDDTPLIVVMHGLTGGSYEAYVRAILSPACRPVEEGGLGYRAVVVNFRGCAGVPITSKQLYSAGWTDDLRVALTYIKEKYPKAPLLGLGFSLGANVVVRYLAEEGEGSRLVAGCAVGCPWDLQRNSDALEATLFGRYVYSKGMANNLLRLLKRHYLSLSSPSPSPSNSPSPSPSPSPSLSPTHDTLVISALHKALSLSSPTLEQFDSTFTRVAGGAPPIMPLPTSSAYYKWASSHHVLPRVRKPLLAINADDDPVVRHVPMGEEEVGNGWTVVCCTRGGGHLGWFEEGDRDPKGHVDGDGDGKNEEKGVRGVGQGKERRKLKRWMTRPVLEWLSAFGRDVVYDEHTGDSDSDIGVYVDNEGWLRDVGGREGLGCKEIGSGDLVDGSEVRMEPGMLQGL